MKVQWMDLHLGEETAVASLILSMDQEHFVEAALVASLDLKCRNYANLNTFSAGIPSKYFSNCPL